MRNSAINGNGDVAFSAFTFTQSGIYLFANGQTTLAVDANTPVPGSTTPLGTVSVTALNDSGQIAFFAQPFPDPNGIFVSSNGQITAIARDGDLAPGGEIFSLSFPDPRFGPVMNNQGDVAFAADLSSGGRAVFVSTQGAVISIAVPGDASPEGSTFVDADAPSINAAGQVTFAAATADGGFGAYLFSNGQIMKVAGSGDVGPKQEILTFADRPQINDLGMVAFGAGLPNSEAATILAEPFQPKTSDPSASAIARQSDTSANRVTADQMKEIRQELSDMNPHRGWRDSSKRGTSAPPKNR
ncbi:MAG: hypothetical protein L0Z53_25080 [Acidobacteriales bacterium]|nr:hypothetical protein [Terriglobales bacterium]